MSAGSSDEERIVGIGAQDVSSERPVSKQVSIRRHQWWSQKNSSIDIDFRALLDFVCFKRQGIFSLPADYRWLYGYLDPVWLRNMKLIEFGIISGRGSIGVGLNDFPAWHKREREHLVQTLGISHYEGTLRSGLV